jgi:hypothetical protein
MALPKLPFTKIEFVDRLLAISHKKRRMAFLKQVIPPEGVGTELGVFN